MGEQLEREEEVSRQRRARIQKMQREKELQMRRRRLLKKCAPLGAVVLVLGLIGAGTAVSGGFAAKNQAKTEDKEMSGTKVYASGFDEEAEEARQTKEQPEGNHTDQGNEMPQGGRDSEIDQQSAPDGLQGAGADQQSAPGGLQGAGADQQSAPDGLQGAGVDQQSATGGLQGAEADQQSARSGQQGAAGTAVYSAHTTEDTRQLGGEIVSTHAVLVDVGTGSILAQKGAKEVINPASMTKILTVLVAAEQIEEKDLDDTFTMTLEITDYGYVHDCSNVGFLKDEVVTVRDLFYGTILKSGADAAVGLATYTAGSHEAFVELMNDKLKALGLSDTAHFTNCVGIYDTEHHCTVYDMAMILEAAMDNPICREVLSARTYTTSKTKQHPDGITISNWFIRRIEDKDTGGEVLYAKTGYVKESGNCAASYAQDENGKGCLCVTAGATHHWKCIYDHVDIYKQFLG